MGIDLRHLMRNLRRSPTSAMAAVASLALTLGAGASIFAVLDAVVLTPPPFVNPSELVLLGEVPVDEPAAAPRAVGYATFERWRERAGSMGALEAFDGTNLTLTGLGAAERVSGANVTPGFLPLLGVAPARGRAFTAADVGEPVVIVSDAFWRGKLAGDPDAVGRRIALGGQPHTIVGVLPTGFFFGFDPCDLWRPLPMTPAQAARAGFRVIGIARLANTGTAAALAGALDDVSRESTPPAHVAATPVAAAIAGDATRTLALLGAAVSLVVLLAFVNLAGLLIVRAIDRRRELAVRNALGASRAEIARQLLLEAQALVTAGVAGGILLAAWTTPVVARLTLTQFGGFGTIANREITINWRAIAVVSLVASACAWLCGLLPAIAAARRSAVDVLRRGATAPPRELALRRVLVAGEVALAFVLLVSMMLVGRSLLKVLNVNEGFDPRGVLALSVSPQPGGYPANDRLVAFYRELQRSLEERLGGDAIAIVDELPLTHDRGRGLVRAQQADAGREAVVRVAGPHYFDVMRIPVVAGRTIDASDDAAAPARAVVSRSLADRLFKTDSAVGRQILLGTPPRPVDIVGVAGDVKLRALEEPALPTIYLSAWQAPSRSNHIVVRSAMPDADVIAIVREHVARLDRELPVYGTRSMREVVDASPGVPARRMLTATFVAFAILAVVLSAIGLFGVVAHDVARRRFELALRIALGADSVRILRAVLTQGAVLIASGLGAGAVLSFWSARALGAMLFAIEQIGRASCRERV